MDFSSANVPISRETWAPRSPVRGAAPPPPPGSGAPEAPRGGGGGGHESRPAPSRDYSSGGGGGGRDYDRPPREEGRYAGGPDRDYRGGGDGGGGGEGRYESQRREGYAPPRPGNAPKAEPNPVLGVFGISMRTVERDLEDEFMRYGDVEKVVIVYDQTTGRSRGFGFVTMRNTEDAARCVEKLNGLDLHGRNIRVDFSATAKPHAPTPGEYMGTKRLDGRDGRDGRDRPYNGGGGGRYAPYDDRRRSDRYDDRDDRRRYDDRDRRDRDYKRDDDPYGGRSRRDNDDRERRRSPSPRRAREDSPERRPAAASRDYERPAAAETSSRY